MKILIFSTAYLPFIGGAEIAVKEITDRIVDIEFDMITARLSSKLPTFEKIGNINVYRIGIGIPIIDKYLLAFFGHKKGEKLNKINKYNVIWSIMASYSGFAAMFFKNKNKNIPFLLTLQEGDDPEYIRKKVRFLKKQFKNIFIKADYIQAISSYLATWAKDNGAICPIEVVPNGVDLNQFSIINSQLSITKFKDELGFKNNEKVIITTSRLVKKNGIGDLIEAMSKLKIKNYKLLIIGKGELENNLKLKITRLQRELASGQENLKLNDKVLMLGELPNEELPKYLRISDCFVRPSLSEGLGNSFLEAMAIGVPVIGTKVGGITDFLINGETGLFCEVNNPESIAEKINLLLSNNDLRNKIIANGKKLVEEKYCWKNISEKIKNIFNNYNNN